jgi:hypothetical protein
LYKDQQQWNFHQLKETIPRTRTGRPSRRGTINNLDLSPKQEQYLERGFLTTGLWRYSRHPNFFCEQAFWCTFYVYSFLALGMVHNKTAIGAVLYVLLFQGSTPFTEYISKGKYPRYVEYQATTSRLIPWLPSASRFPSAPKVVAAVEDEQAEEEEEISVKKTPATQRKKAAPKKTSKSSSEEKEKKTAKATTAKKSTTAATRTRSTRSKKE